MIRKISVFFIIIVVYFSILDPPIFAASKPPAEGGTVPLIKLPVPINGLATIW